MIQLTIVSSNSHNQKKAKHTTEEAGTMKNEEMPFFSLAFLRFTKCEVKFIDQLG